MRQLLLLRHAKSNWDDPSLNDHDRPLDAEGQSAAVALRAATIARGLAPDLILVSSARRTRETLELLEPLPETVRVLRTSELYLASPRQILDQIADLPADTGSVMIIAHNPGLHDLAMMLIGPHAVSLSQPYTMRVARGFPTAALAEFSVAGSWRDLPQGARLVRFLTPHDLQQTVQDNA
ncbi:histidine phosphatase family protein [Acidisoma cellulosilytica]|uniref:Histidine phosphatase family protein n=1 Tax=Acidisoma cellulosilyticum TaxID=2802395 RepID=A0A964E1Y4_9PROT|nr:histidine phosphatase family protein [Acidisoma cellulosilyticum]MCB8879015.1 histidine phosphatase family protein [Acidisoma cellulosilyticum]